MLATEQGFHRGVLSELVLHRSADWSHQTEKKDIAEGCTLRTDTSKVNRTLGLNSIDSCIRVVIPRFDSKTPGLSGFPSRQVIGTQQYSFSGEV